MNSTGEWHVLGFNIEHQQKTNWCWAAVAVSVARFYDPTSQITQCDVANGELGRTDCCGPGAAADDRCNILGYLMSSLNRVGCFDSWVVRRPLPSHRLRARTRKKVGEEIEEQIDQSRPLCARIQWFVGSTHFISIIGYADQPASTSTAYPRIAGVAIADPFWGLSDLDWDDFPARYCAGAFYTDSYYTKGEGQT